MSNFELSNELKAMATLEESLKDLNDDERQRVLRWVFERFGAQPPKPLAKPLSGTKSIDLSASNEINNAGSADSGDLAEFYDQATPSTDSEKTLVVAYWFQYKQGQADIEAQIINTQLKHLGHGVTNITRAFDNLKSQKPALIVQTRKDGTSKQARKKFKVTSEGKKAVEHMLTKEG